MTKISFYLSQNGQPTGHLVAACRLAEKAYQRGHGVYIHTASAEQTQTLDRLLWSFRQGSFVPHKPADEDDGVSPVLIGHDLRPSPRVTDILVNLTTEVPAFFSQFQRLLEVVSIEEPAKILARERFRFYRDRGYELETHELSASSS
jgi:DNA polymerase-3 subunit chi